LYIINWNAHLYTHRLNEKMQYHSKQVGVTRYYFKEFALMNSLMVEPCYDCYRRVREHTLGTSRWQKLVQYRIVLLKGAYKTAKELKLLAKESDPEVIAKKEAAAIKKEKSLGKLGLVKDDGDSGREGTPVLSRNDSVDSLGTESKRRGGVSGGRVRDDVSTADSFGEWSEVK
jgi:hypothetical protein